MGNDEVLRAKQKAHFVKVLPTLAIRMAGLIFEGYFDEADGIARFIYLVNNYEKHDTEWYGETYDKVSKL